MSGAQDLPELNDNFIISVDKVSEVWFTFFFRYIMRGHIGIYRQAVLQTAESQLQRHGGALRPTMMITTISLPL